MTLRYRRRVVGSIAVAIGLATLTACGPAGNSQPDQAEKARDAEVASAGPRKDPPSAFYGLKWKSRPTQALKPYGDPVDGETIYVPKGTPAEFEGVTVSEADMYFGRKGLLHGDLYIDGTDRRDATLKALLRLYGSPDPQPTVGNDYSWSWPAKHIAVDMRTNDKGRTTVSFDADAKERTVAEPQPSGSGLDDTTFLAAQDMSNAAQNMKLAITDGDRKGACANAKTIVLDGRLLTNHGVINDVQRKAKLLAEQFIAEQCPR